MTRAQYGASKGNPAPYTCLKDYRQQTPAMQAENGLCMYYFGGEKSAAQIIKDVGQACGINPKVLLVLLQKEQSLVTDDWPWQTQYKNATGYGCPDTAPCDASYSGFFNQVYNAARQFKKYQRDSGLFSYRANRNNYIQYNPNTSCGGSNVYIENQATASLYNYTPYQPNTAALNNLYGTGDNCSSYGNRNFWRLYNDWFGSTSAAPQAWKPSPSVTITASGSTNQQLAYGSNTSIVWTSLNVSSCTVNPGNNTGTNGFVYLENVTDTTTYTAECTGPNGNVSSTATVTVQPPTFSYLRQYINFAGVKVNASFAKTQAVQNQITQAEQAYAAGRVAEAINMLKQTIVTVNGLVATDRLPQSDADSYAKAANKLIGTWPAPIANGGYPAKWANVPMDSQIDSWGMYNRESTSYAAFKVAQSGKNMPYWGGRGNANQWPSNARAYGIPVDTTPKAGDVAIRPAGYYGHAMYVESVNPNGTINISEYNAKADGTYSERTNVPVAGLVFVHFQ